MEIYILSLDYMVHIRYFYKLQQIACLLFKQQINSKSVSLNISSAKH